MAKVLTFNGQQVGTVFKRVRPALHLLTPPARKIGLFQSAGDVNADSRNLLHAFVFHVTIKGANNIDAVRTIQAIQALAGLVGDVAIMDGLTPVMQCLAYTIDEVSAPELADGFGGRFAEDMTLTAVGRASPVYS